MQELEFSSAVILAAAAMMLLLVPYLIVEIRNGKKDLGLLRGLGRNKVTPIGTTHMPGFASDCG